MVQGYLVVWVSRDSSIDSDFGCGVSHERDAWQTAQSFRTTTPKGHVLDSIHMKKPLAHDAMLTGMCS